MPARHRQGGPHEDGIQRHKAGHCGFIVPYIFAFSPQMLFVDVTGTFQVVQICISALLASSAWRRPQRIPVPAHPRAAAGGHGCGRLGMMIPGTATDIAGFVLVVGIVLYQRFSARRAPWSE